MLSPGLNTATLGGGGIWGNQIEETLKVMEESGRWGDEGSGFLASSPVTGWVVVESIVRSLNKYFI